MLTPCSCKNHFNIILSSAPRSLSEWSFPLRFLDNKIVRISHLPMHIVGLSHVVLLHAVHRKVKVEVMLKVKLSLCFDWAPRHESVLGSGGIAPRILWPRALDGDEWSALRPGHFTPRERCPDTHWIRGWVGPRAVLDAVVKRKIPSPRRESNPKIPIVQPVALQVTGEKYKLWSSSLYNFPHSHINSSRLGPHTVPSVWFSKNYIRDLWNYNFAHYFVWKIWLFSL
jgi:hypothetical protein